MRLFGALSTALCAAIACSPVLAATVQPVSGTVSVNTGSGYTRISGPVQVKEGDRVLVSPGGSVQIVYDGCTINVTAGASYVVKPATICSAGLDTDVTPYVVGAAVVGGGAAAAVLLTQKSNPASP